jgi:hypothetical protein
MYHYFTVSCHSVRPSVRPCPRGKERGWILSALSAHTTTAFVCSRVVSMWEDNFPFVQHWRLYRRHPGDVGIICVQIIRVKCAGENGTLWHPCVHYSRRGYSVCNRSSENFVWQKRADKLNWAAQKVNFTKSYNKSQCHAVSKAFRNPRIQQQWKDYC